MSIDDFNGERVRMDDLTDAELEAILADNERYFPADQSAGMEYGRWYWQMYRDQADEIREELAFRARDADRDEMRDDDERV